MFNDVISEIRTLMDFLRCEEGDAVKWIQQNIGEYDSVFRSDLNRYLTGDVLAREFNVRYEK